ARTLVAAATGRRVSVERAEAGWSRPEPSPRWRALLDRTLHGHTEDDLTPVPEQRQPPEGAEAALRRGRRPLDPRPLDPRPLDPRPLDPRPLDHRQADPRPLEPRPLEGRTRGERLRAAQAAASPAYPAQVEYQQPARSNGAEHL